MDIVFSPEPDHPYQTKREDLLWYIEEGIRSDLKVFFKDTTPHSDGWKLSIQGKSIEDSIFFIDHVYAIMQKERISHKIATKKRYNLRINPKEEWLIEQSYKAMTIYCPYDIDVVDLGRTIHKILKDAGYNGWDDVTQPNGYTLIADGVYYRNDRTENGTYIKGRDA